MKTQRALNVPRTLATKPPSSTETSNEPPPQVRASKAGAARARSSGAVSTAEERGGSPGQPAAPSALGNLSHLFQAGCRQLMRDPFGTALRFATAFFALTPHAVSAQPWVGRPSRVQPLPGSQLESVLPGNADLWPALDLGDRATTAPEARMAVLEKRRNYSFDPKGPNPGSLGRRRLREK